MSPTCTLKQPLLAALVVCALAAAGCSSDGGRGEQPTAPDTSINDTTTTTTQGAVEPSTTIEAQPDTTTTQGAAEPSTTTEAEPDTTTTQGAVEPSTTTEAEPDTTTTQGAVEPSTTTEAEPDTTGDSGADDTTTTSVDNTTTTASEPVVVTEPATTEPSAAEPTTDTPTTAPETTVPDDTTTTTTISAELETSQDVTCGEGFVQLEEFVTETDNGCRQAECVYGRDATGNCLVYWDWVDTLVRDCPTVEQGELGASGEGRNSSRPGLPPFFFPELVPGSTWVAHIELVDNRHWPSRGGVAPDSDGRNFGVWLVAKPEQGYQVMFWLLDEQKWTPKIFQTDEPEGSWDVPFMVSNNLPVGLATKLGVAAYGGGCWVVTFTRTG